MYQINRAVRLNVVDAERVQVRLPHNDHFTIRFDADVMQRIVELSESFDKNGWRDKFHELGVLEEHSTSLLEAMLDAQVIIGKPVMDMHTIAQHEHARTGAFKWGMNPPLIDSVSIVGDGQIARWARAAAETSPVTVARHEETDFVLLCTDEEVFGRMRRLWETSPAARFKAMLWYDGTCLRFGPLHVAGETACFLCYLRRLDAASHFADEAVAYENAERIIVGGGGERLASPLDDLVRYVVKRALLCVLVGQFDQMKPSVIQSWSVMSGKTSEVRVLVNPYCSLCQEGATATRAVRDMA